MRTIIFSLLLILASHSYYYHPPLVEAAEVCSPFYCNPRLPVQFPFRVARNQTARCGYPGFDLSCGDENQIQTILTLPSTARATYHSNSSSNSSSHNNIQFVVRAIDYPDQLVWLSDPDNCLPRRVLTGPGHDLMDRALSGSPFNWGPDSAEYSFLNCSRPSSNGSSSFSPVVSSEVSCMSGENHTVVAAFEREAAETMVEEFGCELIKRVSVPFWWRGFEYGYYPMDMSYVMLQLSWDVPGCGDCVLRGGTCGFVDDSGFDVGCFLSSGSGISRGAKYGLILGAGIPGLICMVGLVFYVSGKLKAYNQTRQRRGRSTLESSPAIFPQPVIVTLGLDRPTIESYPKTVLGESKRLPKPSDGTCPICLSEYQPKETLRSIPECNHYFHAECIDEWLRMNGTCPLCRNSPQKNNVVLGG